MEGTVVAKWSGEVGGEDGGAQCSVTSYDLTGQIPARVPTLILRGNLGDAVLEVNLNDAGMLVDVFISLKDGTKSTRHTQLAVEDEVNAYAIGIFEELSPWLKD